MKISDNKSNFMNTMIEFKREIENALNKRIYPKDLEEIRTGYEGRFSKERFKDYFVKKTALHIIYKYIFIRIASEAQKLVNPKFNKEGITNWNEMSKNYRRDYLMLYKISCEDLRRDEQARELFEPCIYDNYIDKIEHNIFNKKEDNFIEKLMDYDFKTLDPNTAASLFDSLYPGEDRGNLQGFLEDSKVTTYLMSSLGLL